MKLLCPCCHSDNIIRDAYAGWNGEQWIVRAVFDEMKCDDCGASFYEAEESK
jgi:hypothetical protein